MHLTASDGTSFQFAVAGYQFPALATAEYDSNWLNIRIAATHSNGSWHAQDPSLLTYELQELVEWLEHVRSPRSGSSSLDFVEPCLEFHLRVTAQGERILVVHLASEFAPPWLTPGAEAVAGIDLQFPIALLDLESAAASLRDDLSKFPQRAER